MLSFAILLAPLYRQHRLLCRFSKAFLLPSHLLTACWLSNIFILIFPLALSSSRARKATAACWVGNAENFSGVSFRPARCGRPQSLLFVGLTSARKKWLWCDETLLTSSSYANRPGGPPKLKHCGLLSDWRAREWSSRRTRSRNRWNWPVVMTGLAVGFLAIKVKTFPYEINHVDLGRRQRLPEQPQAPKQCSSYQLFWWRHCKDLFIVFFVEGKGECWIWCRRKSSGAERLELLER